MRAVPQPDRSDEQEHRHPPERGALKLDRGGGEQQHRRAQHEGGREPRRVVFRQEGGQRGAGGGRNGVGERRAIDHRFAGDAWDEPIAALHHFVGDTECARILGLPGIVADGPQQRPGRAQDDQAELFQRAEAARRARLGVVVRFGAGGRVRRHGGGWAGVAARDVVAAVKKKAAEAAFLVESARQRRTAPAGERALRRRRRRLRAVALAELVDAAGRIHDLLLARVEGMARGTDFDVQRLADRRARRERVRAAAGHLDFGVLGMDSGFHRVLFLGLRTGIYRPLGVRPDRQRPNMRPESSDPKPAQTAKPKLSSFLHRSAIAAATSALRSSRKY